MDRLVKVIPAALAVAALALVLYQRGEIRRLEARLDDGAPAAEQATKSPRQPAAVHHDSADLARRVASLEQTMARLFRVVLGARSGQAAAAAPPQKVTDLREDVDALLTGAALDSEQGRKRLHQIVRKVQEDVQQEHRQRWHNMRDQMRAERLKQLAKDAGLNENQVTRLSTMLSGERDQRHAIMRAARAGEKPFPQAIVEVRALRQATDQKAKELLDDKQYAEYQKMRERRGRGFH